MIFLYNTLTRKLEAFHPIKPKQVSMYACGPTVYWFAHIGNLRAYVFSDVLRRTLRADGFDVTLIMNITDVGHLTDDADNGEDKMLVAMRREGKTAYEIAKFYEKAFYRDLERLNIEPATKFVRATDHIDDQVKMIQQIEKNGFTYQTSDGVYFDTSKLEDYGRLSGQKLEDKKAGARIEVGEKRHAADFALWKFSPVDSKREMEWKSPWGVGFPGWHIECSAMSRKYLGVPFDIHTGGIDHIPVHHENELAQTEAADGVLEANTWMHSEFVTVDGGKMSKSLGNIYTIDDLVKRGYDPIAYRYFALGAHYRTKLNFTFEALEAAQNAFSRLRETVRTWDAPGKIGCAEYEKKFAEAMDDDLNTPKALAVVWDLVSDANLSTSAKATTLLRFNKVLGLGLEAFVGKLVAVPDEILSIVEAREQARTKKELKESDRLRDEMQANGFLVEDTPHGPVVRNVVK